MLPCGGVCRWHTTSAVRYGTRRQLLVSPDGARLTQAKDQRLEKATSWDPAVLRILLGPVSPCEHSALCRGASILRSKHSAHPSGLVEALEVGERAVATQFGYGASRRNMIHRWHTTHCWHPVREIDRIGADMKLVIV
eukprot:scaffold198677_cov27-Tisochrysis_lutea.AAC.2